MSGVVFAVSRCEYFMKNKKNNILLLQTFTKNNIEPNQNFTGALIKNVEVLDELDTHNIER